MANLSVKQYPFLNHAYLRTQFLQVGVQPQSLNGVLKPTDPTQIDKTQGLKAKSNTKRLAPYVIHQILHSESVEHPKLEKLLNDIELKIKSESGKSVLIAHMIDASTRGVNILALLGSRSREEKLMMKKDSDAWKSISEGIDNDMATFILKNPELIQSAKNIAEEAPEESGTVSLKKLLKYSAIDAMKTYKAGR